MFLRIGLTSKLTGRRPSANVHWFALMHPLSGTTPLPSPASQTLQRETRYGAYSSLGPTHTLHLGLPHRCLRPACRPPPQACQILFSPAGRFDHVKFYLPERMLSSYARGYGQRLAMWAGGKHSLEDTISRQ